MDKQLVAGRFEKAMSSYDKEAIVQRQIADKMVGLLSRYINTHCGKVTEVGCGTGLFSRLFLPRFLPERLLLNDICPEMEKAFGDFLSETVTFKAGDAEFLEFPGIQNLVVSCSALQWFVSLQDFFKRCYLGLSEEGYLAFSTFGPKNMEEVSSVTGHSLCYRSKEELERMLLSDYHLVWSEEELIKLQFTSPLRVLQHLKQTGVTAVQKQSWTKRDLACFCNTYNENFKNEGTVSLTYHPIYIIVKKKNHGK